MKRLFVGLATTVLLSGGVAGVVGGVPPKPVPVLRRNPGPAAPRITRKAPDHWCPGDPPVQTGNLRVNPVVWDANVCHTYWYVRSGQGNVAQNIFEGDAPPPPPPGLNFCSIPPWCP